MGEVILLEKRKKKYSSSNEEYLDKFRLILEGKGGNKYWIFGYLRSEIEELPVREKNELYEKFLLNSLQGQHASNTRRLIDCILEGKDPREALYGR